MLDFYLWGSIILPLLGWGWAAYLLVNVVRGKLKLRYLILAVFVALLLTVLGSAYRPKNKLPQVNTSSYYDNRSNTKITVEKPRIPTTEERVKSLNKQREDRLNELSPLMN